MWYLRSILITEPHTFIIPPRNAIGEFIELRDLTGKFFDLGNTNRMLIKSIGAIHYPQDGVLTNPTWLDSDPTITREGSLWVVRKAWHDFELLDSGFGYTYTSKVGGIASKTKVELLEIDDTPIDQLSLRLIPQIEGIRFFWPDILPDLDFEIIIKTLGVEVFKIFNSDTAPRKFKWRITEGNLTFIKVKKITKGYDNADRTISKKNRTGLRQQRPLEILTDIEDLGGGIFNVTEEWTGNTFRIDNKQTRQKILVNERVYPCRLDQDVSEAIGDTADDGTEWSSIWYDLLSYPPWDSNNAAGFRFQTVNVNQGQQLLLADLIVNVQTVTTSPFNHDLGAQDIDDSAAITSTNALDDWTFTDASVSLGDVTGTGDFSEDITTIIQEIFDRGGWTANNSLSIGGRHTGTGRIEFRD